METLLPAKSEWCNFRKRRSARARKTCNRFSKGGLGFVRRLSGSRSAAPCLAHTGNPTLGASKDRERWSQVPAGMARSVYPQGFEGRASEHRRPVGVTLKSPAPDPRLHDFFELGCGLLLLVHTVSSGLPATYGALAVARARPRRRQQLCDTCWVRYRVQASPLSCTRTQSTNRGKIGNPEKHGLAPRLD
jgi:hypothetical protein